MVMYLSAWLVYLTDVFLMARSGFEAMEHSVLYMKILILF